MSNTQQTRRSLAKQLKGPFRTQHDFCLQFGQCRIKVSSNSLDLVKTLEEYFGLFTRCSGEPDIVVSAIESPAPDLDLLYVKKEPDPGKTRIKEEFVDFEDGRVVLKRLTGMLFLFGQGDNLAVGPCLENANQVVNFINNRYIEWLLCRGLLLGHASGVTHGGKGLALAGFSGAGKSTLALHLMSQGTRFVSNDRLLVERCDQGLVMHGVAKLPRINPGTSLNNPDLRPVIPKNDRQRFAGLPQDELWTLEHKYDVDIDRCFGRGRFVLSAPMNGLFILNWKRTSAPLSITRVDLSNRRDLLPAFMKSAGLFFLPDHKCEHSHLTEEDYIETLAQCTVFELCGGVDFESATAFGMEFLAG